MAMHLEAKDEMEDPQDTEITLGTGKMLVLFFGLVVLCSVFFALGFKLGKGSAGGPELSSTPSSTSTGNAAAKPAAKPSDPVPYKSAAQDTPATQPAQADKTEKAADNSSAAASTTAPADQSAAPAPSGTYYVQVAAVSKQEDAEALVDALKKKQYAAFSTALSDKLYRIQVGPFSDIKEAETIRTKLVGDGYNPILKK